MKEWLPLVLEKRGWGSAAACELTKWLRILRKHLKDLPDGCITIDGQAAFDNAAPTVAQLRHTVVHRLHLSSQEFLDQLHSARMLVEVLRDGETAARLHSLYTEVDKHARKMEHDTMTMQQVVHNTLVQIQKQKEALVQWEQSFLTHIAQQKNNIPVSAGQALDESVDALLDDHGMDKLVGKQPMASLNEIAYGGVVYQDDIESDEDKLKAEL